ncbi:hypothetical protein MUO79_01455 [Candidatus Bathyarchaeota archaeon]|nr:hypothetical protein [Candidatus Bathyarchaeota archaeon]
MRRHPGASRAEARGHKRIAVHVTGYRTTFVLKLPVAKRWKVMRRHVYTREPANISNELNRFLRVCGHYVHSTPYALENSGEVGIEANAHWELREADLGYADDFYDAGGT